MVKTTCNVSRSKSLTLTSRYDSHHNSWTTTSKMNISKCFATACVSSDSQYIYLFGGYNGDPLSTVERYSVISDKWEKMKDMPSKRFMHSAVFTQ